MTLRFAHKRMLARGERLPIAAALHVLVDVCEGLHAVHELADAHGPLGLVHRDLSPDNVILSTSGTAKLIDFGAARATTRTPTPTVFVGKYRYAAPERIRRTDEDRRADVYSAGIILYECLTGVRPFEGPDAEIVAAMRVGRVCDPRERVPSLPARVAEAVIRATAPDRNDRFATARDLGDALSACLGDLATAGKERDVTASLAALMDGAAEPVPILIAPDSNRRTTRHPDQRRGRAVRGRDHRSLGTDRGPSRAAADAGHPRTRRGRRGRVAPRRRRAAGARARQRAGGRLAPNAGDDAPIVAARAPSTPSSCSTRGSSCGRPAVTAKPCRPGSARWRWRPTIRSTARTSPDCANS